MDYNVLKGKIACLDHERVVWFAARCALRAAPTLALKGEEFPFIKKDVDRHLSALFLALNAGLTPNVGKVHFSVYTFAAAYAANYAANYTTNADHTTAATYSAANAARANAADTKTRFNVRANFATTSAVNAAIDAADAAFAYAFDNSAIANNAYESDLGAIESGAYLNWPDLWHNQTPQDWLRLMQTLLAGLRRRGMVYWAEEYENWLEGRFDQEKLERCLFMPESTIKAGPKAMLDYLLAKKLVRTAEARVVFLGEGEAGKTSLIRSLFGEKIRRDEKATPRVEIRQRIEPIDGSDTRIHYWDFGGQVIMHATHQFFLREKSIYVVVLDIRRCDSLEYWLDHVRVFSNGAPTLIVLNKVDLLPTGMETRPAFDLNKIRRRYPFVVDAVFSLSCTKNEGVKAFALALQRQIANSYILRDDMPEEWFQVKEELAKENSNFISRKRFDEICQDQGISNDTNRNVLIVLDILGVAIHFPSLCHNDVVLNPEWITKAIYFIIWISEKKHLNGKLDSATLKSLFAEASTNSELDVEVPEDKCDFLLDLMTEFRLASKSIEQEGVYYVPMLAPTDEPAHDVPREGGLQFIFSLPFLPPGLFYRFIAESSIDLFSGLIWKTGAILAQKDNRGLVEYSEYLRTISFIVHGPEAGEYLTTLRQRLMKMLGDSYQELVYEPYIITPEGERISWREMTNRYFREGEAAKVYTDRNEYSAVELLKEFFGFFGNDLKEMIKAEFELMKEHTMKERNINIEVSPTFSPIFEQNNAINLSASISNELSSLIKLDSDLKGIERIIMRFQENEPERAVTNERVLRELQQDIKDIREDIVGFQEIAGNGPVEEAKRSSILSRINESWGNFAERAKQCYYVAALSPKITAAAEWMAVNGKEYVDNLLK